MNKAIAKDGNEITVGSEVRWYGDSGKGYWHTRTVEYVFGDTIDLEGRVTCKAADIAQVLTADQCKAECADFAASYSAFAD